MGRHSALNIRSVSALRRHPFLAMMLVVALSLPLVGLALLLRADYAQWHWHNAALHFLLFLTVGATAASLAVVTGEAARRRGDARVLLLSLAFMATGGFMALHAAGTTGV